MHEEAYLRPLHQEQPPSYPVSQPKTIVTVEAHLAYRHVRGRESDHEFQGL